MAYRRGFKAEANHIATDVREELGIGLFDQLDPRHLAKHLEIPIVALSDLDDQTKAASYFRNIEPDTFSGLTVFNGRFRIVVYNDAHSHGRQNSDLAHELSHALLHHTPTQALDSSGCRIWDQRIEDEANWLAGALLLHEKAAMAIARGNRTVAGAAEHFGISERMVLFRLNAVGARQRIRREKALRRQR